MDSGSFEAFKGPEHKEAASAQLQRDIARYLNKGGKITELPYAMKSNLGDIPLTERQKMRLNSITDSKRKKIELQKEAIKRGAFK